MGNKPPTADAGSAYSIVAGQGNVTFDASGSSDPGPIDRIDLQYFWEINGGPLGYGSGPTLTMTWAELVAAGITSAGDYPVQVLVIDASGGEALSAVAPLHVNNIAPVARAALTPSSKATR